MVESKLSILICSLKRRRLFLDRLMQCLQPQLPFGNDVELLVQIDDGETCVGDKRNDLLLKASGDYVVFIDDDDLVACNYLSRVLSAAESEPDVIAFSMIITNDGKSPEYGFVSLAFNSWFSISDPIKPGRQAHFASPNHITPVRRALALRAGFSSLQRQEDVGYSSRLRPYLAREVYVETPMYYYLRRQNASSPDLDCAPAAESLVLLEDEIRTQSKEDLSLRFQLGKSSPKNFAIA